ncbi:MAG: shikimate dehydrogenase family protein, partial [Christensenellaceae bacterium]
MAVIGKDVSKSLSPKMHTFLMNRLQAECRYEAISVAEEAFEGEIEGILSAYDFLNVTIPYKIDVMGHLSSVEGDAKTFGAVNTVRARERKGYNTDGEGFLLSLVNAGVDVKGKKALVLGTGGVGRSVIYKLYEAGADVYAYELNAERLHAVHEELPFFTPLECVEPKE